MQTETLTCGHAPTPSTGVGTGYAQDAAGNRYCYACCADIDRDEMTESGRAVLYLVHTTDGPETFGAYEVTNWPGSLRFKCAGGIRRGRHNRAGVRYDASFIGPDGYWWHATQYGDNTQIAHCRRTKERAIAM